MLIADKEVAEDEYIKIGTLLAHHLRKTNKRWPPLLARFPSVGGFLMRYSGRPPTTYALFRPIGAGAYAAPVVAAAGTGWESSQPVAHRRLAAAPVCSAECRRLTEAEQLYRNLLSRVKLKSARPAPPRPALPRPAL